MPILKSHMITGMTFAMKNHYGTIDNPEALHYGDQVTLGMGMLNALPPIRERTRLIIGDILAANLKYEGAWPYWRESVKGDSLLVSFDSVAHDAIGLQVFGKLLTDNGGDPSSATDIANTWLAGGAQIGLGTNDSKHIERVELKLA